MTAGYHSDNNDPVLFALLVCILEYSDNKMCTSTPITHYKQLMVSPLLFFQKSHRLWRVMTIFSCRLLTIPGDPYSSDTRLKLIFLWLNLEKNPLNSATKINCSRVSPLEGSPGVVRPHHPPSDTTARHVLLAHTVYILRYKPDKQYSDENNGKLYIKIFTAIRWCHSVQRRLHLPKSNTHNQLFRYFQTHVLNKLTRKIQLTINP